MRNCCLVLTPGPAVGEKYPEWTKDPDRQLVSLCCEKVVLPRLVCLARAGWDPTSSAQTARLTGTVRKLVADCPSISLRSKHLRELLGFVTDSIKDALDNDVYIPMYTKHQLDSTAGHKQFANRQFWTAFKLFQNILAWAVSIVHILFPV